MRYKEFVRRFKVQCQLLSREKQLAFAIDVCKKLFFDYQNFSENNQWGHPDLILDAINIADRSRLEHIDITTIKALLLKIDQIIPDTDDFGDASYAVNSGAAVYETLEFIIDSDATHIFNIGTYLTDTVDFKIQEEANLTEEQIDKNPLMLETRRYVTEATK